MSKIRHAAALIRLAGEVIDLDSKRKEKEHRDALAKFEELATPFMDTWADDVVALDELVKSGLLRNGKFGEEVDKFKRAGSKIAASIRAMHDQLKRESQTKYRVE